MSWVDTIYSMKVAYLFSKTKCPSWSWRMSCVLYKRFSCILQLPAFMSLSHSKDIIIGIVTKMVWVQPRELGCLKLCKHHFQTRNYWVRVSCYHSCKQASPSDMQLLSASQLLSLLRASPSDMQLPVRVNCYHLPASPSVHATQSASQLSTLQAASSE